MVVTEVCSWLVRLHCELQFTRRLHYQLLQSKYRAINALHKPLVAMLDLYVRGAVAENVTQRYDMSISSTYVGDVSSS